MDIAPRGTLRDISVLLLRQMCLLITYTAMTFHTHPVLLHLPISCRTTSLSGKCSMNCARRRIEYCLSVFRACLFRHFLFTGMVTTVSMSQWYIYYKHLCWTITNWCDLIHVIAFARHCWLLGLFIHHSGLQDSINEWISAPCHTLFTFLTGFHNASAPCHTLFTFLTGFHDASAPCHTLFTFFTGSAYIITSVRSPQG